MAEALPRAAVVAVVGAGAMGAGIAQIAAQAGHPVRLFDARSGAAGEAVARIAAAFASMAAKGKMTPIEARDAAARIEAVHAIGDCVSARLVVEAIVEDLDAKRELFAKLENVVSPECILASNTSSFSITALGSGMKRPGRVVGMHFFNPVPLMPLVEVISGVATDAAVAGTVFATAEAWGKTPVVAADAILATNTSSLSITAIAAGSKHPGRVAGMHFFNPAPLMPLVEIVSGLSTDPPVADTLFATAAAWGKLPVRASSTPGFIVNRCARPFYGEALKLATERAADCATLDAVMREAGGFRMGPFELMDLIGHDVNFAVTRSVWEAMFGDPRYAPSHLQRELVAAGYLGRKSGRGFYDHGPGATVPAAAGEPPAQAPGRIALHGEPGLLAPLVERIQRAGVTVGRRPAHPNFPDGALDTGGTWLALTDGRTASARAAACLAPRLVLVDLALDYAKATRVAIAATAGCDDAQVASVAGALQAAGIAVSRIDDAPGLVVMRTVAMLVNEAADAAHQGIASAADIDTAMRSGVSYPRGPLAWGDEIGAGRVAAVLANLAACGDAVRYRISPRVARVAQSGGRLAG